MKKQKLIISLIILFMLVIMNTSVNAVTQITSGIKYVNVSMYDINPIQFNYYARGGKASSTSVNANKTLEITGEDNTHDSWANTDLGTSYNGQYCAIQGIVGSTLSNGTVTYNYPNENGIVLFPSDSIVSKYPTVYPTVYKNYKFPFYKNSEGYYEFDSNTHIVSVDTTNKKFNLYSGTNTGYTGFFPFNKYTDNLSESSARNYNFSACFEIPMYMNSTGTIKNSSGNNVDMTFNFRGDDDIWIFIDDKLILDMGGCHGAVSGNINFRTKVATVSQGATISNGSISVKLPSTTTFSLSEGLHTIKIFYCERATGESNFKATFNTIPTNLTAKYIDINSGKELASQTQSGYAGDVVYTSAKSFEGYTLVQKPSTETYTLTDTDQTVYYYYDLVRVNLEINKTIDATDSTSVLKLSGARFKVVANSFPGQVSLASPSTEYYSSYTDSNGYCVVKGLPYGNYTIVEDVVPSTAYSGLFYLNNNTTRISNFSVTINENKTYTYNLNDVPKKMNITVYKEDAETGTTTQGDAHLEGAEYTIYSNSNCTDEVETIVIGKNNDGTYSATSGWYLSGTYYVKETKAPVGYLLDETVYTVSQNPSDQTTEYISHQITSKDKVIKNDISITKYLDKTDSTLKRRLSGVIFKATLNSDKTKEYYSTVSDENGNCVFSDLPYGTYTLVEYQIPSLAFDGQFMVGNSTIRIKNIEQFIKVDKNGNAVYTYDDVTNVPKKMNITVYKEDLETGTTTQGDAHLEGAEYTLYRNSDCTDAIETITTKKNEDGTYSATSGWYLSGTYYVKETKAPVGYLIDENVYTITQDPEAQTTEYVSHKIVSKDEVKRNDIELIKYLDETDSTVKQSLEGAVFSATLNSDTSKVYYSSKTDSDGYCIIEDLPYGTYTLKESTIPDTAYNGEFYINGSTERSTSFEQFIELDSTERVPYKWEDITDVPKKMQIKVRKIDSEKSTSDLNDYMQGDATLYGAEYTLYRDEACTDKIETIVVDKIDEEGYCYGLSGWYLVGKYWIKETKAPEGYLIDENVYSVEQIPKEQTEEFSSHYIISEDKVMEGCVRVIKYNNNSSNTDKSPAEGAVLRLSLNSNPDIYYDAVVDENGYCEFVDEQCRNTCYPYTIPYGKYTISEVQASNSGENIFINKQQTEITYNEQTQRYILSDEYVRMKIKIEKEDSETKNTIPNGATFKIWNVNTQSWYEEMIYPSGEYVSEFTTDQNGQLTINRHLEAGNYVLYEVNAPYGYYLDDDLRLGSKGYEFTIGVEADGEVVVYHNNERTVLSYDLENYDNIPTKMYKWTAVVEDPPQKAIIKVTDIAEQFTKVKTEDNEYGVLNTPIFEEEGLKDVEFDIIAKEDIYTPDGTLRYTKGEVVSHIKTGEDGKGETIEIYLGKYEVVQTEVPQGYVLDNTPIDLDIEYTNQYERVQIIPLEVKNKKQDVKVTFEKEYKELEVSKFKFENQTAIFGIYTNETIKNYKGQNVVGKDELVDIITTDLNNKLENNIELPEGKYYVKELYVSNPYIKSNETYEFSVEYTNTNNDSINVTVNNGKIENTAATAELEILVYPDVIYNEYDISKIKDTLELEELAKKYGISNKTYAVYNDESCTIPVITTEDKEATFETDEYGIINIPDMPTGTYYFKEIIAPYGYEISDEVIKAEISSSSVKVVLTASEPTKKAKLLRKTDSFTKDIIKDCTFEILDENENVIYTGNTDKNGIVSVPVLYFENNKHYYYKETSAPDIYDIDESLQEFIAKYDEEKCEWSLEPIQVENDRKTIDYVKVVKKDSKTGEPLQGCVFTIVLLDENGEEYINSNGEKIYLVENAITNEDGEYVIENVPYGTYKFVEMIAPEGYEIDEDMNGITFVASDKTKDGIVFEVTNTGDIAVVTLSIVLIISTLGITYIMLKNKKVNVK